MSVSWSITATAPGQIDTTIGMTDDAESAAVAALAAAHAATEYARVLAGPAARYELRAAGELVAIVQTGTGKGGRSDHAETGDLIRRIAAQRALSAPLR